MFCGVTHCAFECFCVVHAVLFLASFPQYSIFEIYPLCLHRSVICSPMVLLVLAIANNKGKIKENTKDISHLFTLDIYFVYTLQENYMPQPNHTVSCFQQLVIMHKIAMNIHAHKHSLIYFDCICTSLLKSEMECKFMRNCQAVFHSKVASWLPQYSIMQAYLIFIHSMRSRVLFWF